MDIGNVFLVAGIVSALWGVTDFIFIAAALDKRGIPVNPLLFRLFFFRYLNQYRKVTLQETGRVGGFYYSFIIAMNLALVFCVAGFIVRSF
ncbi:hypothetical protein JW906_11030 [bacterium]|nr:hypothetical protein [bacterium]